MRARPSHGLPPVGRPRWTRLRRALCVSILAASAGLLTLLASDAGAATPLTDYSTNLTRVEAPIPKEGAGWARRLRTVPDLTGDGRSEILVAAYPESFGGFSVAGRLYMQDGATRRILYMIDSPQIQSNAEFGFFPAVLGDVNGDEKADFVAGARGQDTLANGAPCTAPPTGPLGTCNQDQGKAWVFSGANGQTLYELNMPKPQGFPCQRAATPMRARHWHLDRARRGHQQRRRPGHPRRRVNGRRARRLWQRSRRQETSRDFPASGLPRR